MSNGSMQPNIVTLKAQIMSTAKPNHSAVKSHSTRSADGSQEGSRDADARPPAKGRGRALSGCASSKESLPTFRVGRARKYQPYPLPVHRI